MVRLSLLASSLLWVFLRLATSTAFLTRVTVQNHKLEQNGNDVAMETAHSRVSRVSRAGMARARKDDKRDESNSDYYSNQELDVVLFGVGDLRTDDHEGLYQALNGPSNNNNNPRRRILPLVILDHASLSQIPGVASHTIDTANMLVAALDDLQSGLHSKLGLELQVILTKQSLVDTLEQALEQYASDTPIRVHVHDLGDADNAMGYGPFAPLEQSKHLSFELCPWTANLRNKPWTTVESLPDRYPDFVSKISSDVPLPPVPLMEKSHGNVIENAKPSKEDNSSIPTAKELVDIVQSTLHLDPGTIQAEKNTGMFQTHWGGLDPKSVGESKVLEYLDIFVQECQEDDALWVRHPQYVAKGCAQNKRSLEHATFNWMLDGTDKERSFPETNNLLAGETMTRYLAAPLMLGTLSPRRLWHMSTRPQMLFVSPLKTLVEGREWHKLLAAKNMRTRPEYKAGLVETTGETTYGYWRWHGFLCRYAQTPLTSNSDNNSESHKEGVLLFHGFGASGAQWNKALQELSAIANDTPPTDAVLEGLAPDLLGFGQSEKPPISYSIYVWDSLCTDFIKEVAIAKQNWSSYIVGGNSIGGFCAASTAANECVEVDGQMLCSSGAPGTGKCQGVVLMNPAGPIRSREDVESDPSTQLTVAQVSATGALPACKPPPRPVARTLGNGLLSYLRPRIQSICVNLYPTNPAAVDDALCNTIERDSADPGGINVMISGAKLPPPRSMNEMLEAEYGKATEEGIQQTMAESSFGGPVLVATGVLDPLNDAKGRSEGLSALRNGIVFDPINAGHCPHDELPKDVATSIAKWMHTTIRPLNVAASKSASAKSLIAVQHNTRQGAFAN